MMLQLIKKKRLPTQPPPRPPSPKGFLPFPNPPPPPPPPPPPLPFLLHTSLLGILNPMDVFYKQTISHTGLNLFKYTCQQISSITVLAYLFHSWINFQ